MGKCNGMKLHASKSKFSFQLWQLFGKECHKTMSLKCLHVPSQQKSATALAVKVRINHGKLLHSVAAASLDNENSTNAGHCESCTVQSFILVHQSSLNQTNCSFCDGFNSHSNNENGQMEQRFWGEEFLHRMQCCEIFCAIQQCCCAHSHTWCTLTSSKTITKVVKQVQCIIRAISNFCGWIANMNPTEVFVDMTSSCTPDAQGSQNVTEKTSLSTWNSLLLTLLLALLQLAEYFFYCFFVLEDFPMSCRVHEFHNCPNDAFCCCQPILDGWTCMSILGSSGFGSAFWLMSMLFGIIDCHGNSKTWCESMLLS